MIDIQTYYLQQLDNLNNQKAMVEGNSAPVTKTREVLIATPSRAGEGPKYQHPQQFDYNNPLSAIHY